MQSCPICSNKNSLDVNESSHYIPQDNSITKINTKILYCIKCDFFYNSFRNNSFYKKFYEKNPIRDVKIYKQYDLKKLYNIIKTVPYKKKNILEIGGGENITTKDYFLKYKTKIFNLEQNPKYVSDIFDKINFDVILSFHVLEHVLDLHSHILYISEKLKHNGYLIIEVPDIKYYNKNIFLYNNSHVNHFSKKNLIKLFLNYNLHLVKNKIKATRKFGLLLIFQKKTHKIKIGKLKKRIGINLIKQAEYKILKSVSKSKKNHKLVIWGISEFITPILKNLNYLNLKKNIYFVDINPKKKQSLKKFGIKVLLPNDLLNKNFKEILILSPRKKVIELIKEKLYSLNINYKKIKISNIGTNKFW